jgi:DNA invertase Pin-like site-specific DNA recombinase
LRLDAYIRVSRVGGREGPSFISPTVQSDKIRALANLRGYEIVAWHEDLDESGTKNSRPGFQAALERVEKGDTEGVIVAKLDRFARSVPDAANAIRRIQSAGGQLVSVDDNFDSSTPIGKFAVTMMLAIAELEVDRIRESWRVAQELAVRRGVHVASRTPTGYQRGPEGRLVVDELAGDAVREVFLARARGESLREIAAMLESAGVVGPYGNETWTASAVAKLLSNRVYLGEARSGKHRNAAAHDPLVSFAEWTAAQHVRPGTTAPPGAGALLAGILRCAGCRYVMKPDRMRLRDGAHVRIYRCRGEHAAGRCRDRPAVMGRVIEPYIVGLFLDALDPGGPLAAPTTGTAENTVLRDAVDDARLEFDTWRDSVSIVSVGRDTYLEGLRVRKERLDAAESAYMEEASRHLRGLPAPAELRAAWSTFPVDAQRRLLSAGIDAVMLRASRTLPIERRTLVLWRGSAPDDFPRRGRRVPLRPFDWPDDPPVEPRIEES